MSEDLISIIIPSYNHEQYIEQAISSALNQTHKNIELIIIDDGSSDNSHEVIRKYSDHDKVRVFLNKKNRGQSAVLNEALDVARGKFISLLPSDDWYLPEKSELQLKKFKNASPQVGVIYGTGIRYFEDAGSKKIIDVKKYRGNILRQLLTEPFCVYPITPLFRRECFEKVRFDESYRAEGEALYVKLAIYFEFDYVDEPVAVMRDHSYNIGKNVDLMYEENFRYWTEFFNLSDLPENIRPLKNVRIGNLKRLKGLEKIVKNFDFIEGRRLLLESVSMNPVFISDKRVIQGIILSFLPKNIAKKLILKLRK